MTTHWCYCWSIYKKTFIFNINKICPSHVIKITIKFLTFYITLFEIQFKWSPMLKKAIEVSTLIMFTNFLRIDKNHSFNYISKFNILTLIACFYYSHFNLVSSFKKYRISFSWTIFYYYHTEISHFLNKGNKRSVICFVIIK